MELVDALKERDLPALKAILAERPAAAREPTPHGVSPLTLALYMRYSDAVDLLLTMVEPDAFQAAILGDPDACLRQLTEPDARGPDGFTPLHLAAHFGHADLVDALVERGSSVSQPSGPPLANEPLHAAAAGGALEAIQVLLRHGAAIDARDGDGNTALMVAAAGRYTDVVRSILAAGADPQATNDKGETALSVASDRGYPEVVELLSGV